MQSCDPDKKTSKTKSRNGSNSVVNIDKQIQQKQIKRNQKLNGWGGGGGTEQQWRRQQNHRAGSLNFLSEVWSKFWRRKKSGERLNIYFVLNIRRTYNDRESVIATV